MFTREELSTIARLCHHWDVLAITDEIYEHIVYDDCRHVPMATVDGMADRTITINSLSKTFAVTGWRVGWAIAPASVAGAIRKVHDFLTVGAPAPLQEAGVAALGLPESHYVELAREYQRRRNLLLEILERHEFGVLQAEWCVLHHDRHRHVWFLRRCRVCSVLGDGDEGGGGAWQ